MKLTYIFSFFGLLFWAGFTSASESAIDCPSASETLRAGIQENPDKVLMFFDDAIKSNPSCLRSLLRVTVATVANDPSLLTQVIHVAVNEFPEKNDLVAQTAFEVAPQASEVIKNAFFSMPPRQVAEAESMETGRKHSPVDRYIEKTQPELEEQTPVMTEADDDIIQAISHLDRQIGLSDGPEEAEVTFRSPDRITVTEYEGEVDETTLEKSGPIDEMEEEFEGELKLTFQDPQIDPRALPALEIKREPKPAQEVAETESNDTKIETVVEKEVAALNPGEVPPSMSTYFIPSLTSANNSISPATHLSIVLRSVPVSPTSPR